MADGMRWAARSRCRATCGALSCWRGGGGLDVDRDGTVISIERRSRLSGSTRPPASCLAARVAPADRAGGPRGSWRGSPARVSRSRWRRRPAGGSWSRSSQRSARRCIWPSRRRRPRCGEQEAAKTDRADARHLRELLLIGRLPESWIPPDHILDLARSGPAPSYAGRAAHGVAAADPGGALSPRHARNDVTLLPATDATGSPAQPLPDTAREQVTVALAMIDALDAQLAPFEQRAARYARRKQPAARR